MVVVAQKVRIESVAKQSSFLFGQDVCTSSLARWSSRTSQRPRFNKAYIAEEYEEDESAYEATAWDLIESEHGGPPPEIYDYGFECVRMRRPRTLSRTRT